MNYKDHCEEQGVPIPTEPLVFNKFPSCVVGPTSDLPLPPVTDQLDWEVELCIVMGSQARNVTKEQAMDYVYGFTAAHDVSARDWQLKRYKSFIMEIRYYDPVTTISIQKWRSMAPWQGNGSICTYWTGCCIQGCYW